ncbi:hypothetical protein GJU40_03430 [Bacillus lacus]|uniref:YtxH domain-containing protein n=1 Tax=Metabacillus lacus TaxID=1983721 RepID=A0A7X2IWQ4_9BACI|nr:YtxH domain-containing protein [Metabacillus lacus]MRX71223.1 hypothetical protein [Metabacillus lacus]
MAKNKETKKNEETETNDNTLQRTLTGALIGAAVGYAATPENGKRLAEAVSPGKMKDAGSSLCETVKEKTKSAASSLKDSASKLFHKKDEDPEVEGFSTDSDNGQEENDENETSLSSNTDSSNEDTGNSDDSKDTADKRLERLEKMVEQLAQAN